MIKVSSISFVGLLLIVTLCLVNPKANPGPIDFENYYVDNAPEDIFQREYTNLLQSSMFAGVGTSYSHAAEKHGSDGQAVKDCIEGNGVIQVWENPFSGHCAEITKLDDNHFGIRIVAKIKGKFEEITAFTDEVEGLWEIEEYMIDGSYMQIWGYP